MTALAPPQTGSTALPSQRRSPWVYLTWGVIIVLIAISCGYITIDMAALRGLPQSIPHYLYLMFSNPDWSKLQEALFQTWRSVAMAWIGALIGVIISTVLGILAANTVSPSWVRLPLRGIFAIIRAVPEIIIAIIILTVTGLTPFTGALALAIGGVGTHAKWTYEAIETAPTGPAEAVQASGGTLAEMVRWGTWPIVQPELASLALYRFEINVRTSAVLGLIGVGGIGDMLTGYTQYRQWDVVGVLLIVVVIITMTIDAISGALRRRLVAARYQ
ncbi:phosphonate ABC transporter, permease protein PhnE [Corynebacterium macginleyi]|uniref:phosphonate ABC transporter, permease protein PhnE n=1 Tax=Corynebacterium macginleyi TaxID=38290 RepID=UPI00190CA8D0|nr:phosphonate ABC transporter, permease protein PhnE [Corynebacterium macginleyi]MBK4150978.1 phosphonate ABC transporter, permease protein PhnE [Corynebacterium macginleyi]